MTTKEIDMLENMVIINGLPKFVDLGSQNHIDFSVRT